MFLRSLLAAYFHIILHSNARNSVSENLIFKISRGSMPLQPPRGSCLRYSFDPSLRWIAPSRKKPAYGPELISGIQNTLAVR